MTQYNTLSYGNTEVINHCQDHLYIYIYIYIYIYNFKLANTQLN